MLLDSPQALLLFSTEKLLNDRFSSMEIKETDLAPRDKNPMTKVTTAQILVDRTLNQLCEQRCVDWAISMLEEGHDGDWLRMLAGKIPPCNHFEIADLRDRTLHEQGITDLDPSATIRAFTAEQLRLALSGEVELFTVLETIKDLFVAQDHMKELYDFYLLFWAYTDLSYSENQWYWDGATRENIDEIVRHRAVRFLQETSAEK